MNTNKHEHDCLQVLRYKDFVERKLIGNRTTLRRWMEREDDPFPQPIKLGPNSICWRCSDVEAWFERRAAASKGGVA